MRAPKSRLAWIRRDGMFYCGPVYLTQMGECPLVKAIRTEPLGTFRAIGGDVYSTRTDHAAQVPEPLALRVAAKLGGTLEVI